MLWKTCLNQHEKAKVFAVLILFSVYCLHKIHSRNLQAISSLLPLAKKTDGFTLSR